MGFMGLVATTTVVRSLRVEQAGTLGPSLALAAQGNSAGGAARTGAPPSPELVEERCRSLSTTGTRTPPAAPTSRSFHQKKPHHELEGIGRWRVALPVGGVRVNHSYSKV